MFTSKQYAAALHEAAKDKKNIKDKVRNFVLILKKNYQFGMVNKIIDVFEKLEKTEKGIEKIEIISANKLNSRIISNLKNLISKITNKKITVQEKEDKGLLGGAVIKWQDWQIDLSVKRQLEEIKFQITKSR